MARVIKDRVLSASVAVAALFVLAPTAGATGTAKAAGGNVGARQVALLRNDGRRAQLAPQRLALSGGKAVAYASFNVPKSWSGKPIALVLTAQRKVRVTVSAVRAGELGSLRWTARPSSIGAAVSTELAAGKPERVSLQQLPASGRLVLQISARGRAVITGILQIAPRATPSSPNPGAPAGGGSQPGSGSAAPGQPEPPVGAEQPADSLPSDPSSPSDPADPSSPFADLAPQLIGAPPVSAAALTEASGLAESAINPGVYWTHNDSGDRARLFAIDAATGALRATFELPGVTATDWEDLAIAPDANGNDAFYIADIGDNNAVRSSVKVYRAAEPTLPAAGGAPVTINAGTVSSQRLTYPGGPRDAESLAIGADGALTVVSKREAQVGVYRLANPQFVGGSSQLDAAGTMPLTWVVGASASPDGSFVLIKTLSAVRGYAIGSDESVADALIRGGAGVNLPYSAEPQGEAVAASISGRGHATISEGIAQPLQQWRW